ncbi:MAG: helix-turn-helix domain-containing protein [Lachnospiraceae bacterium]
MAVYEIGNYIHDLRLERGYSQEDLSHGICSCGNLSKIENGTRMPSRKTVEALMQRLGSEESFLQYATREELHQVEICNQIVESIAEKNYVQLEVLVEEFQQMISEEDILNSQYCRFARTLIKQYKGMSMEKVIVELEEILHMTKPEYRDIASITKGLLTYNEIVILINLANSYADLSKRTEGIEILYGLKEYMDTHIIDANEKMMKYPLILFNLSNMLIDEGYFEDVVEFCDLGIELCIRNNRLRLFPQFLVNKGVALMETGKKEQAKELLRKGYNIFDAIQEQKECHHIKRYLFEKCGLKID